MNEKLIVSGGAGQLPSNLINKYATGIRKASSEAFDVLISKNAIDAVELAVRIMEDNPVFNAGIGSVLTENGNIEMDAMIMDGHSLKIGGVIGLQNYQNPISIARKILEYSQHILFQGVGANQIAENMGFKQIKTNQLITERSRERYQKWLENQNKKRENLKNLVVNSEKFGTVGAIAIDKLGHLAAATSTGGTLGKKRGRVGDTPIPGAGNYADSELAISATGHGESIIRTMLALRIKNNYQKVNNIKNATVQSINDLYTLVNGRAGVIILTNKGEHAIFANTREMAWCLIDENSQIIDFTNNPYYLLKNN